MIEFRHVVKDYNKEVHALRDVSFTVEAGEFVFLIGESGAGKSTVIKLLTCEENPSSGNVFLDNFEISNMKRKLVPMLRRKVGLIFQDFRLIESKTVYENVAFAMEIVGAPKDVIALRVPMTLSLVGLRGKADAYPGELSGGEAQRVGIARAMVNNPRLILADEPTGNLDSANSEAIMALLDEINRAGTTVIACTHDLKTVERMNKRVIELRSGKIVRDDLPRRQLISGSCFVSPADERSSLEEIRQDIEGNPEPPKFSRKQEYAETFAAREGSRVAPALPVADGMNTPLAEEVPDFEELRSKLEADAERRRSRLSLVEAMTKQRMEEAAPETPLPGTSLSAKKAAPAQECAVRMNESGPQPSHRFLHFKRGDKRSSRRD